MDEYKELHASFYLGRDIDTFDSVTIFSGIEEVTNRQLMGSKHKREPLDRYCRHRVSRPIYTALSLSGSF